jgi:hypothetical protein
MPSSLLRCAVPEDVAQALASAKEEGLQSPCE